MSFTDPTTSVTLGQRRMNGWGQAMAFPGPPPMTIEDPGDIARESTINVQGADPNAVVDALKRYMRTSGGSVPIRVSGL